MAAAGIFFIADCTLPKGRGFVKGVFHPGKFDCKKSLFPQVRPLRPYSVRIITRSLYMIYCNTKTFKNQEKIKKKK